MTEIRQPHHFQPISSDDIKDNEEVKPWRLPFWTEKPAWLVEKEQQEQQQKAEAVEEETFPMPTAEELENIRRDAYNAGLEQGLVEGRQQGEKQGYEEGLQRGLEEGRQQGEQQGRQQGFTSGETEGLEHGKQQVQQACEQLTLIAQHLKAGVLQRDQQLPQVLVTIIRDLTQQVLQHELTLGHAGMEQFIHQALTELPGGEKDIQIFLSPADITHLDKSGFATDILHFHSDPKLSGGDCRIETERTLVEYSVSDHLNQLLESFIPQLLNTAENPDENFAPLPTEMTDVDNTGVMPVDSDADNNDGGDHAE